MPLPANSSFEQDWVHIQSPATLSAIYLCWSNGVGISCCWPCPLLCSQCPKMNGTLINIFLKKKEANLSMVFSFYPQLQKRKRWFAPERKVGIKESPIRQRDNNPVTVFTIKFCVFVFINIAFIYWFKTEKNFQSILKKKLLKNKMTCGWAGMCTNPTKIDKWSTMSDPLKWFKWMTECHSFG